MHGMKLVIWLHELSSIDQSVRFQTKGQVLHLLKNTMTAPKVVIVGGGIGGVTAAQQLEGFADVTLIDRRDYFEIPWSNVRIPVDPALTKQTNFLFQEVPKLGKVLHATASSVSASDVALSDDTSLPFDYLVLASGSTWTDPVCSGTEASLTDRRLAQQKSHDDVVAAKTVLIIGGGAVGVELAAEIAEKHPDKAVTLVQSHEELVPGYSARMSRRILSILRGLKVEVLLSEKAQEVGSRQYKLTPSGRTMSADKVYVCTGGKPNTAFLQAPPTRSILDQRGYVKVNDFLQVDGHPNWFAIGDITSLSDYRLGRLAADQGKLVASQITALHTGALLKPWKKHNGLEIIVVSLGRNDGAMAAWGWGWSGWVPAMIKSRDLLVAKTRTNMGLVSKA